MSLEDKIKKILQEAKKEDDEEGSLAKAEEKDEKDAENDDSAADADNKKEDGDDKDDDKEEAEVKESSVPGTDALLGTKQSEKLKDKPEEISGKSKTSKMTSAYSTSGQEKLPASPSSGASDATATGETAKIKSAYKTDAMPKLKEEAFEALFAGEELTEEFKTKAEAIFEAAVEQVSEARIEALQEEYQAQLDEAVEAVKGELVEQIDVYLDHAVKVWMQDNAVALESGLKVEMVSTFMEEMKAVFEKHYIDVPESKVDVVEEQEKTIDALKSELAESQEMATRAVLDAQVMRCEAIVAEHSAGLTAIEADKLKTLSENVDFNTDEEFSAKVKALKESYFRKGTKIDEKTITPQESTIVESKTHTDVEAVMKVLRTPNALKVIRSSN